MDNRKGIMAIIVNGRHGGDMFVCEYSPVIKCPIRTESQISIGEKEDRSVRVGDCVEYKECFRAVDKKCVLYSTSGRWEDIKYSNLKFRETYPITL